MPASNSDISTTFSFSTSLMFASTNGEPSSPMKNVIDARMFLSLVDSSIISSFVSSLDSLAETSACF